MNLSDSDYLNYFEFSKGLDLLHLKRIKTMVYTIMFNRTLNFKTPYFSD